MQLLRRWILVLAVLALPLPSYGAAVAYINASGGTVNYLTGYGHTVTNFDDPVGLTIGDLAGFDALIIASNSIFSESTNIGNVAGQFADAGGGVVLTEFVFQGQWALGGQIMTPGYSPFTIDPLSGGYNINSNLGVTVDPASPLFAGVNTANVTTQFQAQVALQAGATLVASWDSGRLAIGFDDLGGNAVVGLNLFPDGFWTTDADTQRLVANAVSFSISSTSVPEPGVLGLIGLALSGLAFARRKA